MITTSSRRISLLARRPVDLFQFLPGLLNKFASRVEHHPEFFESIPPWRYSDELRWRVRQDSNLQQPDLESGALPIGATDPLYLR